MNKTNQATRELVIETIKSRADARGPRVVVFLELPEWPPRISPHSPEQPSARVEPGRRFVQPAKDGSRLRLLARGTLSNEGLSTAIITLDGSAQFNSGSPVHPLADDRFALLPGDSADFTFEDSRTVAEWATGWHRREKAPNEVKLVLLVRVEDQFDDGIGDYTHVYMGGYPIVPIEGDAAGWEVRGTRHEQALHDVGAVLGLAQPVAHDEATPKVWSSVLPTRRHYFRSRAANQVLGADDA